MTNAVYQQAQSLLLEVLEKTPEEREDYIRQLSKTDETVVEVLRAMLAASDNGSIAFEDKSSGFFGLHAAYGSTQLVNRGGVTNLPIQASSQVHGVEEDELDEFFTAFQDQATWNYQVEAEYGRGGLGRVLAARDRRLGRIVALKEMLNDEPKLRKRFAREALITAQLEHPSIVPVYEVGVWYGSKPYYTMKLVHGQSLRQLIENKTSFNERLPVIANVLLVADALAYAHSKGVIHRDLKPENVIIGDYGETVVIDWGLAKKRFTKDESEVEHTPLPADDGQLTGQGTILGTPAYMPPEQARGEEVSPQSDVYAIGALLYYVIGGQAPYHGTSSVQIIDKVVKESPPPLDTLVPVRADLVAVVDKAMARNPAERYANAEELRDELQRYQDGQLVEAHKYPLHQRVIRTSRRLATPILTLVFVLSFGGFFAIKGYQSYIYNQIYALCDKRAEDVTSLWGNKEQTHIKAQILAVQPKHGLSVVRRLDEQLDRYAHVIGEQTHQLCLKKRLYKYWDENTLVKSWWCLETGKMSLATLIEVLGQVDSKAVWNTVQSAAYLPPIEGCTSDIYLTGLPKPPPAKQRSYIRNIQKGLAKAAALEIVGKYQEGLKLVLEVQAEAEQLGWIPLLAMSQRLHAKILGRHGEYAAAEKVSSQAYLNAAGVGYWGEAAQAATALVEWTGVRQAKFNEARLWDSNAQLAIRYAGDPLGVLAATRYLALGKVQYTQANHDEAITLLEKALKLAKSGLNSDHPLVGSISHNLGNVLLEKGEYDRAIQFFVYDLQVKQRLWGENHPDTAKAHSSLARVWRRKGYLDRAIELYEQVLTTRRKILGDEHPDVAETYNNLAAAWRDKGEYDKAIELHEKDLAISLKSFGPEHLDVATTYNNLAATWRDKGEYDKAIEFHKKDLAISLKLLGPEHPDVAITYNNLANIWRDKGEYDKAIEFHKKDLAISLKSLGPEHPDVAITYNNLATAWREKGEYKKAIQLYGRALAISLKSLEPEHPNIARIYNDLGTTYQNKRQYNQAVKFYKKALEMRLKSLGANHPHVAKTCRYLASVLKKQRAGSTAKEHYESQCTGVKL